MEAKSGGGWGVNLYLIIFTSRAAGFFLVVVVFVHVCLCVFLGGWGNLSYSHESLLSLCLSFLLDSSPMGMAVACMNAPLVFISSSLFFFFFLFCP